MLWPELRDAWVWEMRHGNHQFLRGREKWFYPATGWKKFTANGVFWDMIERKTFSTLFVPHERNSRSNAWWVPIDVKERIITNLLGEEGCYDFLQLSDLLEYMEDFKGAVFETKEYGYSKPDVEGTISTVARWKVSDKETSLGFKALFDSMKRKEVDN